MSGVVDASNGGRLASAHREYKGDGEHRSDHVESPKGSRALSVRADPRQGIMAELPSQHRKRLAPRKIASSAPTEGAFPLTRARSPRVALDGTATATMTAPVLPGEPLRHADEVRSGPGTYVRKSVVAAVMGHARTTPAADDADDKRPLVEVIKGPVVTGDATGRGAARCSPRSGTRCSRGYSASTLGRCGARSSR